MGVELVELAFIVTRSKQLTAIEMFVSHGMRKFMCILIYFMETLRDNVKHTRNFCRGVFRVWIWFRNAIIDGSDPVDMYKTSKNCKTNQRLSNTNWWRISSISSSVFQKLIAFNSVQYFRFDLEYSNSFLLGILLTPWKKQCFTSWAPGLQPGRAFVSYVDLRRKMMALAMVLLRSMLPQWHLEDEQI